MPNRSDIFKKIQNQINSPAQRYDEQFENNEEYNNALSELSESVLGSKAQPARQIRGFDVDDYSKYLGDTFSPEIDIKEERAESQSTGNKLAKIPLRAASKAVTEAIKIPGEMAGLGEWALTGFDAEKFSESMDNAWTRAISDVQADINEDIFPVYTRREVAEGNLWNKITSSEWWATTGADGIGFMLGMMAPGAVTRALKSGVSITKALKGLKLPAKVMTKIAKYSDDIVAGGVNTLTESAIEGVEAAKSFSQNAMMDKFQELMATGKYDPGEATKLAEEYINTPEFKKKQGTVGANTVKANMGILLVPNILDQVWLFNGFGRGAKKASKLNKTIRGLGKAGKEVTPETTKDISKNALKTIITGSFKEGFWEEGMQFSSSKYFQNRERGKTDKGLLAGVIDTYYEGLTGEDTELAESIFLGSVLGGGIGAVGNVRGKRLENRLLFGDPKKKTEGLVKLFENNFENRYKSLEELAIRNEQGEIQYDKNTGNIKLDPEKVAIYGEGIKNDAVNKVLMETYKENGMKSDFELAKDIHDFKYMSPFLRQEGGKEMLIEHINTLAAKDVEYHEKILGVKNPDINEVKKDLLEKVELFDDIYTNTLQQHNTPNLEIKEGEEDSFNNFNNFLLSTKFSNKVVQANIIKTLNKTKNRITELESKDRLRDDEQKELDKLNSQVKLLNENYDDVIKEAGKLNNTSEITNAWEEYKTNIADRKEDGAKEATENSENPEQTRQTAEENNVDPKVQETVNNTINEQAENESIPTEEYEQPETDFAKKRYKEGKFTFSKEKNELVKYLKDTKEVPEEFIRNLYEVNTPEALDLLLQYSAGNKELEKHLNEFFKHKNKQNENKTSTEDKEVNNEKETSEKTSTNPVKDEEGVPTPITKDNQDKIEKQNKEATKPQENKSKLYNLYISIKQIFRKRNPKTGKDELYQESETPMTKKIDWDVVNSSDLLPVGSTVKAVYNPNESWTSKGETKVNKNLVAQGKYDEVGIALYKEGVEKPVGFLFKTNPTKEETSTINQWKKDIIEGNITEFVITEKIQGDILFTKTKSTIRDLQIANDKKDNGTKVTLGIISRVGDGLPTIETNGINVGDIALSDKLSTGSVVWLLDNGKTKIPMPLVTKTIKEGESLDASSTNSEAYNKVFKHIKSLRNKEERKQANENLKDLVDIIAMHIDKADKYMLSPRYLSPSKLERLLNLKSPDVKITANNKLKEAKSKEEIIKIKSKEKFPYKIYINNDLLDAIDPNKDYEKGSVEQFVQDLIKDTPFQIKKEWINKPELFETIASRTLTNVDTGRPVVNTAFYVQPKLDSAKVTTNTSVGYTGSKNPDTSINEDSASKGFNKVKGDKNKTEDFNNSNVEKD